MKSRNNKGIFPAAILLLALISHVIPAENKRQEAPSLSIALCIRIPYIEVGRRKFNM